MLNIQPATGVDHVGSANKLSFDDETFDEIYASHILEHVNEEPHKVLTEWNRVLKPDGRLYISVPDMTYLCQLFVTIKNMADRVKLLGIIFGGHTNEYDYHVYGYDKEILSKLLVSSGFVNVCSVEDFGIFNDCSKLKINDRILSINLEATKTKGDNIISLETSL